MFFTYTAKESDGTSTTYTLNVSQINSIEWNKTVKEAEVEMVNGNTFTVYGPGYKALWDLVQAK